MKTDRFFNPSHEKPAPCSLLDRHLQGEIAAHAVNWAFICGLDVAHSSDLDALAVADVEDCALMAALDVAADTTRGFPDADGIAGYATLWFATNNLPHSRDVSPATIQKRCILLEFNKSFDGENRDLRLKEKLREELPGILSYALQLFGGLPPVLSFFYSFRVKESAATAAKPSNHAGSKTSHPANCGKVRQQARHAPPPVIWSAPEEITA